MNEEIQKTKEKVFETQKNPAFNRMIGDKNGRRETSVNYHAYTVYRDLGAERRLEAVAKKLHKSLRYIGELSSRFSWVERCWEFDLEQDRLLLEKRREKRVRDLENIFDSLELVREVCVKKVRSILPLDSDTKEEKEDKLKKLGGLHLGSAMSILIDVCEVQSDLLGLKNESNLQITTNTLKAGDRIIIEWGSEEKKI